MLRKNQKIVLISTIIIVLMPLIWWVFFVIKETLRTGIGKKVTKNYYHRLSKKLFAYNDKCEVIGFKLFGHWWQLQKDIEPQNSFEYSNDDLDAYSDISPLGQNHFGSSGDAK